MMRLFDRFLLVFGSILLMSHVAIGRDAPPALSDSDVHVERSGSGFSVDFRAHAPVSPAQAWAVLTDFEHMADFVPNLKSSRVLERSDTVLRVSQVGTARYGIAHIDFESVREITLSPPREIRAHGVGGSTRRMDSVMRLEADASGTQMQYHAEVEPDFWLPPLIGPSFVRHETAEQFSAMIQEMLRRR